MILADTLKVLTTMGTKDLSRVLDVSGHQQCSFKTSQFLGITNGGDFCYKVTYLDQFNPDKDAVGKVFVKYDTEKHAITADF